MASKQAGVGLLEILITIVLLSVGFLTMARMQVQGMRFSQSAYLQSQASFMAADMVDRMRANIDGVKAGHYDGLATTAAASNPGCQDKLCDADDLANQDLYDWSAYLYSPDSASGFIPMLPSGGGIEAAGRVVRIAPGQYSVRLSWMETIDGAATAMPMRLDFVTEY